MGGEPEQHSRQPEAERRDLAQGLAPEPHKGAVGLVAARQHEQQGPGRGRRPDQAARQQRVGQQRQQRQRHREQARLEQAHAEQLEGQRERQHQGRPAGDRRVEHPGPGAVGQPVDPLGRQHLADGHDVAVVEPGLRGAGQVDQQQRQRQRGGQPVGQAQRQARLGAARRCRRSARLGERGFALHRCPRFACAKSA